MTFRNYDAWLTTDRSLDYEPPPQPKCAACGAFLPWKVERVENKEDVLRCDGTVKVSTVEHSPGVCEIIGVPEGTTYEQTYSDCGIDTTPHAPHDEVQYAWSELHRTCRRCGHDDVTID